MKNRPLVATLAFLVIMIAGIQVACLNHNTLAELPMTASLAESASALNLGNSINFTVTVEGGTAPYNYTWNIEQPDGSWTEMNACSSKFSLDTTDLGAGSFHVYAAVTDSSNNTAKTLTVEFNVLLVSGSPTSASSSASPTIAVSESPMQQSTLSPSSTVFAPSVSGSPVIANIIEVFLVAVALAAFAVALLFFFSRRRG